MAALPRYLCRCSADGSWCDYGACGGCSHHDDISRNPWKIPLYSNSAAKQALEDWQEKEAKRLEAEKFMQSFAAALSTKDDEAMEDVELIEDVVEDVELIEVPDDPGPPKVREGIWRFEDKWGRCCLPAHDGRRRLLRKALARLG